MFRTVPVSIIRNFSLYIGADNSLARSCRKQDNVSARMSLISFGPLPCRGKKNWWQLASRCCWNRARPWRVSELVSFLFGLRTYQSPGTNSNGTCHPGLLTACEQDQDGALSWSCSQAVSKTCMTYTIAVCTVKNSWRWTEELFETCRFLFQK